jgi:cytochrome c oxidase subunit 2
MVLFVGTLGAAVYWAIRHRRRAENESTPYIPGNYLVEFISIFGISVWVAVFFLWGWRDYAASIAPHMDEYEINVIGQQWSWQMQYANGKSLMNELYVPRGRPVRLVMTSKDVLHSFFVPEFRTKQDVVPGQFTSLRFHPTVTGDFHIFCAEYCGTSHSKMIGTVHVLEPGDFQKWLDGAYTPAAAPAAVADGAHEGPALSLAQQGEILFKSKTCNACHTVNGSALIGPGFKGLFGSEVELIGGSKVRAEENYLRESIMEPMAKIVKGYSPQMPTFRGMLSDEEVNQLIAYIKTLK